jgi:D-alanine-D-alanine ligase-like ATP-grasp enzyme
MKKAPMMRSMKRKKESFMLGTLLKKLAPQIGATVELEPLWKIAGKIVFKNGKQSYFLYNAVDLNAIGSSRLASDKDYANFFMQKLGYKIVEGETFFRPDFAKILKIKNRGRLAAYAYAKKLGFPVFIKPNSGSQGSGTSLVHDKNDLDRALSLVFKQDRIALVQRCAKGRDYRIVVLDDEVISAYERIALNVVGDGTSTIHELLERKAKRFIAAGRDTHIKINDKRIEYKLAHQKLSLQSRPQKGVQIFLLDNANLSSGGDSVDVTGSINPFFKQLAIKLTKDMGLRFSGVDIMIEGGIDIKTDQYQILEINDTPGLDHYVTTGPAQRKVVEDLYLKVLKAMDR